MEVFYIKTLIEILHNEMEVYSVINSLSLKKRNAVIKDDVEDLDGILSEEMALKDKLEPLADKRVKLTTMLCKRWSLAIEDVSLGLFVSKISSIDENLAQSLESTRQTFSKLLTELDLNNKINQKLLQTQLDNISATLEVMSQASVLTNNYNNKGMGQEYTHRVNLVDTSV